MTLTRPSPTVAGAPVSTNGQAPPARGRNVNVGRLVLGVILVVGLGAGFAVKYAEAGNRKTVLAVARAVPAGQAIVAADLKEALVSADPALHPVPASEERSVVGHSTAVALVPGTLLSKAQLATGPLVALGRDVVGLSLKAGQVPLGLRPGDRVIVVRTPTNATGPGGGGDATGSVLARGAQVLAVQAPSSASSGTTVASVVVDSGEAAPVAAAAASGQASLVVEGGR